MTPTREVPYAYVNRTYSVGVTVGQRVEMYYRWRKETKTGVVVKKLAYDHYVHVKFDGTTFDVPVHPLDLKYL